MDTHLIENIITHLRTAQIQRAATDDKLIAEHIDEALRSARVLRDVLRNDLSPRRDGRSWYSPPSLEAIEIETLASSCIREPFADHQREYQADHQDKIDAHEIRIGQRVP